MKYLFILGRNIELSIAEIKAFFERKQNRMLSYYLKENSALIDLEKPLEEGIINLFGGIIAIGKVISFGNIEEISKELEKKEIYFGTKKNFNYVLWDFSKDAEKIENYLKKRFKIEKVKATRKKIGGELMLQSGEKVKNLSSEKLIDEQYFLFEEKGKNYFGRITEKINYEEIEKRDMEKPVRRQELSISPRLAKIMINLSQTGEREILVDCFCGIGVILQEALIQNIKVIGIDRDTNAIEGAKQNLEWAGFPKDDYKLINFDSRKVKIEHAKAIATEPDLGDILKKIPTKQKAKEIIQEYENLMNAVLNNLQKNISGRIVFTAPLINALKERISCNIENILNKTGLILVEGFPIPDFRQGQFVGREIFVLEKKTAKWH